MISRLGGGYTLLKICHIITGLENGGAEAVLYRLVRNDSSNSHCVVSLTDLGVYGDKLLAINIQVYALYMSRGRLSLRGLWELYLFIVKLKPDVVQTWMYHADLVGGIIARLAGVRAIVWCIRNSNLNTGLTPWGTCLSMWLCARISGFVPLKIVSCSVVAAKIHADRSYRVDKIVVVKNGYDLTLFKPSDDAKKRMRERMKALSNEMLIGMVARWSPQKDHENLFLALSRVRQSSKSSWSCILIGPGMTDDNADLMAKINKYDLGKCITLIGAQEDIPAVMNGLDLHILSSAYGEAFPNVLCEAMACGTPCIATDVGDAAKIVCDTGWIVRPRDSLALSEVIEIAIGEWHNPASWEARRNAARKHVVANFSLVQMIDGYRTIWSDVRMKN